ncbi:MAG: PepSY domain-containing protein [Bacteroidetes bacterium]|nr:PepSY domain-containing protein [Bacteroidota bacterium]MBU1374082.1 PepSY domain-containing protein [Bacteroidota bacterium]MBU1484578.1 PepSY domain-containing protein [Bacteroidota bacterium]MBU1760461.1 PepSY domain-containing protein [Bacteroidota bacterium]MBU2267685.1 PepSY domain-containing protein [Bacteroidota bacterium]
MAKKSIALKIRKTHRYLGLFIGIQFIMWTVSGLYFSWSNINEIHGDQFRKQKPNLTSFNQLISPSQLENKPAIQSIELKEINHQPYYWVNKKTLYNALNGDVKGVISEQEALFVAQKYMKDELKVKNIKLITQVDAHHEYREKLLPAYVISYHDNEAVKAYVSANDGTFQTIRHRSWRWFDFLWMTHTMDYEGRDNMNNFLLRSFSLLGLITVLSGFLLWYISSPSIRKLKKLFFKR